MNLLKTMLPALSSLFIFFPEITQAQSAAKPMSWYVANSPFPMPEVVQPSFPDRNFLLSDYGANSNGHTLNTDAFQKAIQACAAAGGGHVIVPPGNWMTGPIELKSHVDLHLQAGAIVQFTNDHRQ